MSMDFYDRISIKGLLGDVEGDVASAKADILTNAGDISTNAGNISTNADNITAITIEDATVGEDVTAGDLCYLKSDGKYWLANASAEATSAGQLRIAREGILADASGSFLIPGGKLTTTGLTVGEIYFIDTTTPGAYVVSASKPSGSGEIVRVVGYAESTTVLVFEPSSIYLEIA